MKKLFFTFLVLTITVLSTVTAFAIEGDGTEETPFLITDQGELELVTDFPDCYFRLENDIVLEGTWIPLCEETSSGYFKGVFDGNGYTISNLTKNSSYGGLFRSNSGVIKNVNVLIAEEGMIGNGAIAHYNTGTISNCAVEGNISWNYEKLGGICAANYGGTIEKCKFVGNVENSYSSSAYTGGICATNDGGTIEKCKFVGNVENSYNSTSTYTGGICGDNYYNSSSTSLISNCAAIGNVTAKGYTGGICGYNGRGEKIENCYFIGQVSSESSYKGGIVGCNDTSSYGYVTNCYAVPTFNSGGYGIGYSGSIGSSYYDKTVSGLSSTTYGTPKSTAAMKMEKTYTDVWDFDTVWGIDKNINDGYPYLLWEYDEVEEVAPYTVNNLRLTDLAGAELYEIPNESFYLEVSVTKNDDSKNADSLIIALYDENDMFIDLQYMSGVYYQNQTITFGAMINETDKEIAKVKAFVWDSLFGMKSLSNEVEFAN